MGHLDPLGITVFLLGLALLGLAALLLRVLPRLLRPIPLAPPLPPELAAASKAVLLIQSGGRVLYINQEARELFGILEEETRLERLIRRTHPNEVFLGLCAAQGQARFTINGRFVEGASFFIPYSSGTALLVSLEHSHVTAAGEGSLSGQELTIFAELSRTMAASLDLEKTLESVLESVERLIPSDLLEVSIWDSELGHLIPYHFGDTAGFERQLEKGSERCQPGDGYAGFLAAKREPLHIDEVDSFDQVRPKWDRKQYPYHSYLGIPLLVASELIGTLELASFSKKAFSKNDLEILRMLSGQAAAAIHNALLYQEEQHRILELSGLSQMSRAVSALQDPKDLYARLIESIHPLLAVQMIGYWLYNESQHRLEAQTPFVGLPTDITASYYIPIEPNSQAEEILLAQEMIITTNAPENLHLETLGLAHLAQAAGVKNSILTPLSSAGRLVGYLQIADKIDGEPFDQDDLRLLSIVATQSAVIIENATLVQQTQRRAMRSEALRRIASLTGSSATLDEVLQYSLIELARLLQADVALVYLLDEARGVLRLHRQSIFGLSSESVNSLGRVSAEISDSMFSKAEPGGQSSILTSDAFEDLEALPIYRDYIVTEQLRSVINVPLVVRDRTIGEFMLANRSANFYDRSDIILIATAAGQLAAAIEQFTLYKQTDQSLRQRVEQLTSLSRISRELNSSIDLGHLLRLVFDEVLLSTRAKCGRIVLFDPNTTNGKPRIRLQIGDAMEKTLSGLELFVLQQGEALIIDDFERQSQETREVKFQAPHQEIRTSLIVPIAYQDRVAGMIHLHAQSPGHFDESCLEIAQTLSAQAAIAIGNAQRYHEQQTRTDQLNRRVDTLNRLFETIHSIKISQPLDESLVTIVQALQKVSTFGRVILRVYDPQTDCLRLAASAVFGSEGLSEAHSQPQSWEEVENSLRPEYCLGGAFIVRANMTIEKAGTNGKEDTSSHDHAWQPEDRLLLPIIGSNEKRLGLITLEQPPGIQKPDQPTLETLAAFASQAALTIESQQQITEYRSRAEVVERDLERAVQSAESAQSSLPELLQKDLEQTLAIQGLSQRARRIRAGLDIAEIVNRQPDRLEVLKALTGEVLTRMDLDVAMAAEPSSGGLRLLNILGSVPSAVNPEALLGQRNPVRQCQQTGVSIFVHNLKEDSEWNASPLLQALDASAFICLAIPAENSTPEPMLNLRDKRTRKLYWQPPKPSITVEAVLLAVSQSPMTPFTEEDEQLFTLLARQVAIALQNQRLLSETSRRLREVNLLLDFSRQLGSLDPLQILQTLADSILHLLPAAQSCLIALWDGKQQALVPQVAQGYQNNQRLLEIRYRIGEALPGQVFESGRALRVDEVNFSQHYNLPPENLLFYRDSTGGRLPVSNLVVPISGPVHQGKEISSLRSTQPLGVIILDNFQTTAAFTHEDLSLISSLVQQTALTLENARLYQASEQRTIQLQTLTNVAATITSSLQTDELIASLLDQARAILPYDTGTLWLRHGEQLTIRAALGFADSEQRIGLSVAIVDSRLLKEMIDTGRPIFVEDVREDPRFPSLIEHTYLSWLGIPLMSKGEVVGVIALEKTESFYYTPEQIQAATTFAGQAAVALENANLYEDSLRRTTELDQRSNRLALLNRLSTELSSSMDPAYLLKLTSQELLLALNCSAVSALLFDKKGKPLLQAETPQTSATLPYLLPDAAVFDRLRESLGIYNIEDIHDDSDQEITDLFSPLVDYLNSRSTRALMTLSLATGSELHGLIIAHQSSPYRFSAEEVELARTIANQAAVAVQNAQLFAETQHLYAETQQRSGELASLFELGVQLSQILDQQHLMTTVFEHLATLLSINSVALVLENEKGELSAEIIDQGEKIGPISMEKSGASLSEYVIQTGLPLIIGDIERDRDMYPVAPPSTGGQVRSWLGIPLVVRGATIGVLSVQSSQPDLFGEEQTRLVGQVANQLAIAIDNTRLISTVQNYAADLEQRVVERTAQLAREHERTETLLAIITELSTSLDMDIVLARTLDLINETVKAEQSQIVLSLPEEKNLFLRTWVGYNKPLKKGGELTNFRRNEGLAGWVISKRQAVLISDLLQEPRWVSHDEETDPHRSALAVPLMMGEDTLGALLLFHPQTGQFSPDQLELVQATAQQIAVAINNAQLFNLIRDQAERLGDMLRQQHVETSRSQAILEAVADGVLVTDGQRVITLFNASAEQILGMQRRQVLGRSLEHFTGLFGKAAHTWVETIQTWSEDPSSYQAGDIYSEQIELDDKRVVSVHLSPVYLRKDFLGTVSTFRDITHQVEVDRLKSEFVATVSHELRTPMTSIKGYVEVMLMGAAGSLSEQQSHFLKIVKSNTERLAILVNDLLDVSRIEAGRVILSIQGLDLCSIAREAVAELERRTEEENRLMQLVVQIPENLPLVSGDPDRVRQIIDNLLENAFLYTPEGGQIGLQISKAGPEIQIDVQDNGIGIQPKDQPRVFERFYRGEDPLVLASSGTGLGLSIVQRLIEMHSGRIWLTSSGIPGEGSTFSFTLPVFKAEL